MNAEYRFEADGTIFRFCITSKGKEDGGYRWTDAVIEVSNWCLNYRTSSSFLEFSELIMLKDKLSKLVNDEMISTEYLEFIESDICVILKPKHDIRTTGKYSYIKEGYEIEDISAEFLLYPFLDGAPTEQHYVMPLYREDIVGLLEYINAVLAKMG